MTITARFVTVSRDDLFAMTRALLDVIKGGMLQDPADPVVVAVTGSGNSGKKIVADAARDALLGESARMGGLEGMDEYWTGHHNGEPCEVHFIDTFFYEGYSNKNIHFADYAQAMGHFMDTRTQGGLTVVQNPYEVSGEPANSASAPSPALSVHIESPLGGANATPPGEPPRWRNDSLLSRFFAARATRAPWLRYVEVALNDPRLQEPVSAHRAFAAISPLSIQPRAAQAAPVSVWGQNMFIPGTAPCP